MVLEDLKVKLNEAIVFANEVKQKPHRHVSFSQFSMYSQCAKKWFLSYALKLGTRPPSIHMTFGTAFHEVLQEYITLYHDKNTKENEKVNFDTELINKIKEIYKRDYNNYGKHFSTSSELSEFCEQGVKILNHIRSNYNSYYDRQNWTLLGVEVPLMVKILNSEEPVANFNIAILNKNAEEFLPDLNLYMSYQSKILLSISQTKSRLAASELNKY